MRTLTTLLFLLVSCAVAQDSVLARLESETRALAELADRTVVDVTRADGARTPLTTANAAGWVARVQFTRTTTVAREHGVLVGTPPRVVVPHALAGAANLTVHLPGGRKASARRIAADADLGLGVYALPDEVAKELVGIPVESDWTCLAKGSLAVAEGGAGAAGPLGLLRVGAVDPTYGLLSAGATASGAALVGTRGTLLGIRQRAASVASCTACHATGTVTRNALQSLYYVQGGNVMVHPHLGRGMRTSPHFVAGPVVARVLDDLDTHGRVRFGYLGVVLGDAVVRGNRNAVIVNAVLDGSPAAKAGLGRGDRVIELDGAACANTALFSRGLAMRRPGDTITLTLLGRGNEEREVKVVLGDRVDAEEGALGLGEVGLHCVELTDGVRAFLEIGGDVEGVVVQHVVKGGVAARAGLRRGDVITDAGAGPVTSVEELRAALAAATETIVLRGFRGDPDKASEWTLRPPDRPTRRR